MRWAVPNATLKDTILDLMKEAYAKNGAFEFWPQQFLGDGAPLEEVIAAMHELAEQGSLVEYGSIITSEGGNPWAGLMKDFPTKGDLIEMFRDDHKRDPDLSEGSNDVSVELSYQIHPVIRGWLQPGPADRTRELAPVVSENPPAPERYRLNRGPVVYTKDVPKGDINYYTFINVYLENVMGSKNTYTNNGNAGGIGENVTVGDVAFYNNTWKTHESSTDLKEVASDLKKVIEALQKEPAEPKNINAIGLLEAAYKAAMAVDGPKLLTHLKALPAYAVAFAKSLSIGHALTTLITAVS